MIEEPQIAGVRVKSRKGKDAGSSDKNDLDSKNNSEFNSSSTTAFEVTQGDPNDGNVKKTNLISKKIEDQIIEGRRRLLKLGALPLLAPSISMASTKEIVTSEVYKDLENPNEITVESSIDGSGDLPIMQAFTNDTQTELIVLRNKKDSVAYYVRSLSNGLEISIDEIITRQEDFEKQAVDKIFLSSLNFKDKYSLRVINQKTNAIMDYREFGTLDIAKPNFKMALASCMNVSVTSSIGNWEVLAAQRPDIIVLAGDNAYLAHLGKASQKLMWENHIKTRSKLPIFRTEQLIPIFSTWDDHDFGTNNGDRTFVRKDIALDYYEVFFGDTPESINSESGPGNSSFVSMFGVTFLFLDDRYYRSEPGALDVTHWGVDQEEWIFNHLKNTRQPTFLINGSQFFGAYHQADSVEKDHLPSLKALCEAVRTSGTNVILIAGDRHYSEIMELEPELMGKKSYEITSSSIHSLAFRSPGPNPRRLSGLETKNHNFMIIEIQSRGSEMDLNIKCMGKSAKIFFQVMLKV
jgi:hypothetical protein